MSTPTTSIKEVFILDGAGETLVLLRIVVLETNLKVDGFREFSFLGLRRVLHYFPNTLEKSVL